MDKNNFKDGEMSFYAPLAPIVSDKKTADEIKSNGANISKALDAFNTGNFFIMLLL